MRRTTIKSYELMQQINGNSLLATVAITPAGVALTSCGALMMPPVPSRKTTAAVVMKEGSPKEKRTDNIKAASQQLPA